MRIRPVFVAACIALLAACSPQPRSASYFEAHQDETAKVLADCTAGTHRGEECANAQAADAKLKSNARMKLYKSGFK